MGLTLPNQDGMTRSRPIANPMRDADDGSQQRGQGAAQHRDDHHLAPERTADPFTDERQNVRGVVLHLVHRRHTLEGQDRHRVDDEQELQAGARLPGVQALVAQRNAKHGHEADQDRQESGIGHRGQDRRHRDGDTLDRAGAGQRHHHDVDGAQRARLQTDGMDSDSAASVDTVTSTMDRRGGSAWILCILCMLSTFPLCHYSEILRGAAISSRLWTQRRGNARCKRAQSSTTARARSCRFRPRAGGAAFCGADLPIRPPTLLAVVASAL